MTCSDRAMLAALPALSGAVEDGVKLGYRWAEAAAGRRAHRGTPPPGVAEPFLVAGIVLRGAAHIQMEWSRILAPGGIRVGTGGVFCHGSPIVDIVGAKPGCELGDLLLVHVHSRGKTITSRNALLLQAKVAPSSLRGAQLALYSSWPDFTYRTGPHSGQSRRVTPPSRTRGAQVLELSPPPCFPPHTQTPSARVAMAASTPVTHSTLGDEVARMTVDLGGRQFSDLASARAESPGDWSRVVWDLLEGAQGARSRWGPPGGGPRYGGVPIEDIDSLALAVAEGGPDYIHGASVDGLPGSTFFSLLASMPLVGRPDGDPAPDPKAARGDREPPRAGDDRRGEGASVLVIHTQGEAL